ncbi:DUF35 OB-fold domain-containing protein, acyl-CoA-associated [Actinomadura madurae]|uniref:DUF35 OB-fold domain-containing protein, acyl-CoA-associated n=1 Tax=Actinomadura madurae TaxID=1993 RepID=A0A1I5M5T0_9ACTN|nr:DUF35 OB-fold domain-containing protein, acyl-CoA-associated [Actinomadura madurae]
MTGAQRSERGRRRQEPVPVWERYPDAALDDDSRHLYEGWLERELRLPRCADCGAWHAPPRAICPWCWSFDVVPTKVSGRGVVHLSMLLHQGPQAEGVSYPHPVVTVELAEQAGLRFTSTIIGSPALPAPIGTAVELAWTERAGAPYPVFRTVTTQDGARR